MTERTILHSDLNGFFASVECMLDPQLKGKTVAVCGSADNRHGIILAKSEAAKKYGIQTGEAVWQAKQKCPGLITVQPHFDQYLKYSELTREIYARYTDRIESFGIDEAWLDLTADHTPTEGFAAADKIRETVKNELGLTVSVGVSFCKVFAKLCSDIKKPDAVTFVPQDEFKNRIWPLPAGDMLYVGKATAKKLARYGIFTIGQLAETPVSFLEGTFGKCGGMIWKYANGLDTARVADQGYEVPVKSMGHGITTATDLTNRAQVAAVFLDLSQEVGRKLRDGSFCARRIQITVRDNVLHTNEFQTTLRQFTQSADEIAKAATELFERVYDLKKQKPVRMLTVRAVDLIPDTTACQLDLFTDQKARDKQLKTEIATEELRRRFGDNIITKACLLDKKKWMDGRQPNTMPSMMYK